MKVLLLNTSEKTGGAAIACRRLMEALNSNGVEAKMLVRDKQTANPNVYSINANRMKKLINKWRFLRERLMIFIYNKFSKRNLFSVSIANSGTDISNYSLVQEADIIHLHWINQGFLSLKDIEKLTRLGKPIIWTMHDMWPSTGICHYSQECNNYYTECCHCFYLHCQGKNDLSRQVFLKKKRFYQEAPFTFVTCSDWLKKRAWQSDLLKGHTVTNVPNPINTTTFNSHSPKDARTQLQLLTNKKLILFGAAKITDKRKGIDYFIDSCHMLVKKYPNLQNDIGVVVYGKDSEILKELVPFEVFPLNYISSDKELINVYNAVDLFVISSLEDNLPNTIMEAMSCGTPCVGFKTGGIPEMIDHKVNGYVANYKDAEDLANGICWVLEESDYEQLSQNARKKVEESYSEAVVAEQYKTLYQQALAKR